MAEPLDFPEVSSSSELEEVLGTLERRRFTDKADTSAITRNFQFLEIVHRFHEGQGAVGSGGACP